MVGSYDISPSEYWGMSPSEVWIIVEAKRPKIMGGLHEDDWSSIAKKRDELINQGIKVL